MKRTMVLALAVTLAAPPASAPAYAWGARGHEMVSGAAIGSLSQDIPAFLRTQEAHDQIMMLGRELDMSKGSGRTHAAERNPGHYINLDDAGLAGGIFALDELPPERAVFDAAFRVKGIEPPQPGFLPYAIIDGWQQIVKDFAYWRTSSMAEKNARTQADRDWFVADRKLRELLLIRDIGVWTHYVGDASQPQHVTSHFAGWEGVFTDPMTYPPAGQPPEINTIHAYYEGPFVRSSFTEADVKSAMSSYRDCSCYIDKRVPDYLMTTWAEVRPFYTLVQSGDIRDASATAKAFTLKRLAAGASETRDMIEDAWKASATAVVGFPNIKVADVLSGDVVLTPESYGWD